MMQGLAYRILNNDRRFYYYILLLSNMKKSREQIVEERDNSIEKLIQYAYSHTDYYQELFDSNKIKPNDIKSQNDLRYIPILTKQILAENSLKIKSSDKYSKKWSMLLPVALVVIKYLYINLNILNRCQELHGYEIIL